jgi:WD40 repeat protein
MLLSTPQLAKHVCVSPASLRGVLSQRTLVLLHSVTRVIGLCLLLLGGGWPEGQSRAADDKEGPTVPAKAPMDADGVPLPPGAVTRMGSLRFRHDGRVVQLHFLDGGKTLVSAGGGKVCFWEVPGGKETRSKRIPGDIWAMTRDGRFVASAVRGKTTTKLETDVEVWDMQQSKRSQVCRGNAQILRAVALSPDGQTLAVSGEDNTLRIWKVSTGEQLHVLKQEKYAAHSLAFSANGGLLAWGETAPNVVIERGKDDRSIHIFDVQKGKQVHQFKNLEGFPLEVAFSPVADLVADGFGPRLWNLKNPERGQALEENCTNPDFRPTFSPDGSHLAVSAVYNNNNEILVWDLRAKALVSEIPLGERFSVINNVLAISPDNKLIAVGLQNGDIGVWRIATKEEFTEHSTLVDGEFQSLMAAPDGKIALTLTSDGLLLGWDVLKGKELYRLNLHKLGGVRTLTGPAGNRFAVTAHNGLFTQVTLHDLTTGKPLKMIEVENDLPNGLFLAMGTAFFPDGKLLVTTGKQLRFWDTETGKERHLLEAPVELASTVAFSPDGKRLAVHSLEADSLKPNLNARPKLEDAEPLGKPIQVFNTTTGKLERQLSGARNAGTAMFFVTQDVVPFVGIAFAGDVFVWDGMNERPLKHWRYMIGRNITRTTPQVIMSPDGRFLVRLFGGAAPLLVEVATGEFVGNHLGIEGHRGAVTGSCFVDGGRRLITAGTDNTLLTWDWVGLLAHLEDSSVAEPAQQRDWWTDLESLKASVGVRAVAFLTQDPKDTIPLLREQLKAVPPRDARRIARLITSLDDDAFETREAARKELQELGELADPELRAALKAPHSENHRRLLADLVAELAVRRQDPGTLRSIRAIQVLEYIGTAEAQEILTALAKGEPLARQTKEAQAALARLRR